MSQCDENCKYYKWNCTNAEAEDNWEELAENGGCPGFYGTDTARYDKRVRFAEKG